jgi:hypothetical protein
LDESALQSQNIMLLLWALSSRACRTRNRHFGTVEDFPMMWMTRKDNCESSSEIRRNRAEVLMQQTTTYRVQNRNSGYERYTSDAEAEGYLSYSKAHVYLRNKEMGLHRYGTEKWAQDCTDMELKSGLRSEPALRSFTRSLI